MTFNFKKEMTKTLIELGAKPSGYENEGLRIETQAGKLDITVFDEWVATRFQDTVRARQMLPHSPVWGDRLNPHSGKWNFHFNPPMCQAHVDYVRNDIEGVLPITQGELK